MKLENRRYLYNASAHFATEAYFREKYGEKYEGKHDSFTSLIMENSEDGLDMLCFVLAQQSRQAEAYQKYIGQEAAKPLDHETLKLRMKPLDIGKAREIVFRTFTSGLARYDDEEEEVDLVLLEIERKKKETD